MSRSLLEKQIMLSLNISTFCDPLASFHILEFPEEKYEL